VGSDYPHIYHQQVSLKVLHKQHSTALDRLPLKTYMDSLFPHPFQRRMLALKYIHNLTNVFVMPKSFLGYSILSSFPFIISLFPSWSYLLIYPQYKYKTFTTLQNKKLSSLCFHKSIRTRVTRGYSLFATL